MIAVQEISSTPSATQLIEAWLDLQRNRRRTPARQVPEKPEIIHLPAESLRRVELTLGELTARYDAQLGELGPDRLQTERRELMKLRANLLTATFRTYSWEHLMRKVAREVRAWLYVHKQRIQDMNLPQSTIERFDSYLRATVQLYLRPSAVKADYLTPQPIADLVLTYLKDTRQLTYQPSDFSEDVGLNWFDRLTLFCQDVEKSKFEDAASWMNFISSPEVARYIESGQATTDPASVPNAVSVTEPAGSGQ